MIFLSKMTIQAHKMRILKIFGMDPNKSYSDDERRLTSSDSNTLVKKKTDL